MSETPPPSAPSLDAFKALVALLENDPEAATAAQPQPPSTAALVTKFPSLANVSVTTNDISTAEGAVPGRLYTPTNRHPFGGFVWVHGGAFLFGDLDMPEANWVGLALASRGVATLSVDYRKAVGSNRFPAASNDVLAAWQWAVANADRFGVTASALHLGGASAGGNLVAGVTKRVRDNAGPSPRSAVLVYPVLHPVLPQPTTEITAAFLRVPGAVEFTPDLTTFINLQYAGTTDALFDPYAFAANGDLSGHPPTLILNAEADQLRASGEAYATALADAGVDVEVLFEPDTGHGYLNEPDLETAWRSIDRIIAWIERPELKTAAPTSLGQRTE
jgi:acetyl esterase